jgi:hypothetical protein
MGESHPNPNPPENTLDGLWDESLQIMREVPLAQREGWFRELGEEGGRTAELAVVMQSLCSFWEESVGLFDALSPSQKEAWIRNARLRGPFAARFAEGVQELLSRDPSLLTRGQAKRKP